MIVENIGKEFVGTFLNDNDRADGEWSDETFLAYLTPDYYTVLILV